MVREYIFSCPQNYSNHSVAWRSLLLKALVHNMHLISDSLAAVYITTAAHHCRHTSLPASIKGVIQKTDIHRRLLHISFNAESRHCPLVSSTSPYFFHALMFCIAASAYFWHVVINGNGSRWGSTVLLYTFRLQLNFRPNRTQEKARIHSPSHNNQLARLRRSSIVGINLREGARSPPSFPIGHRAS